METHRLAELIQYMCTQALTWRYITLLCLTEEKPVNSAVRMRA